jgi:hypothetical protein
VADCTAWLMAFESLAAAALRAARLSSVGFCLYTDSASSNSESASSAAALSIAAADEATPADV